MSSDVRVECPGPLTLGSSRSKTKVTFKRSFSEATENSRDKPPAQNAHTKKFRFDPDFKPRRKRTNSCSVSWDKRRRSTIILPTKFLLGGNIGDPLNLEALKEEDADLQKDRDHSNSCRGGEIVRVIIPPNINDPLNLDASSEDGEEQLFDAIYRQRRRRKKRRRRNSEPGSISTVEQEKRLSLPSADDIELLKNSQSEGEKTVSSPILLQQFSYPLTPEKIRDSQGTCSSRNSSIKKCRLKAEDKIVSPVVPQPGVERKRHVSHPRHLLQDGHSSQENLKSPVKYNSKSEAFRYGNYNQYYGYRNPDHSVDPRLKYFRKEWFENKSVLDIGCNIGHISLCVARDFSPQKVLGIDIDKKLIKIAQKNIRHYFQQSSQIESPFPKSMRLLYGPIKPPITKDGKRCFPYNVSFSQSNYVLEDNALLETIRPEYDVILGLSITKWIHLNWGDDGLKKFFKRIFNNLNPGGFFILEPQPWKSYTRRRKLTADILENYRNIRLYPDKFGEFLTKEIGFCFSEKINVQDHFSKGFRRSLIIYRKGDASSACAAKHPQPILKSPKDLKRENFLTKVTFSSRANVIYESSPKKEDECERKEGEFSPVKSETPEGCPESSDANEGTPPSSVKKTNIGSGPPNVNCVNAPLDHAETSGEIPLKRTPSTSS